LDERRRRFLYLQWSSFNHTEQLADLEQVLCQLSSAQHVYVVLLGESFTNSVWHKTNTFQQDKQLSWTALNDHGFAHDGTFHREMKQRQNNTKQHFITVLITKYTL